LAQRYQEKFQRTAAKYVEFRSKGDVEVEQRKPKLSQPTEGLQHWVDPAAKNNSDCIIY
jgi:hypothetical protein